MPGGAPKGVLYGTAPVVLGLPISPARVWPWLWLTE